MKLFYREYGTTGQPLIILHGLLGSSDNWLPQAKMLSDEYHVYVIDQRNHGQSPHSNEFTYADLVNDLRAFINEHRLAHPVLLGHSMGGKTVMHYALRYPEEVERLIVVDIAPKPYDVRHDGIVNALQSIPIDAISSRQEADAILSRYISEQAVRQFLLKNLMRKPQGGFGWRVNLPVIAQKLDAISAGLDMQGVYKNPALFIRGAHSDYISDEDRGLIKKYFPASTLVTLNTGHWVQAEKPEEFVNTVRQFLHAR
ncbi:MAG: alpha/beta fold hydrolase [Cyclobacteriaceae bacterium]|nr:alpha/beta fold hydrolase [Cyclobacteriaceae bacterium]MCX7636402.1 alpha/beta fold hydrolase [Cyclobacteriaceae bacterium]MDW8330845.1 alpha/beta fold hydrolase [Cyclobacteriaceae bacterium]